MIDELKDHYDALRKKNEGIREERKRRVYEKIPEIAQVDAELRRISANMALSAFDDAPDDEELLRSAQKGIKQLQAKRAVLLTDHDFPPDYLDHIYTCEVCKDRGFIKKEPCKCYVLKKFEHASKLSKLRTLMKVENFENFNYSLYSDEELPDGHFLKTEHILSLRDYMYSVVHCLKEFLEDASLGVYLYGDTGVGKTFLCSSICKFAVEQGKRVEYHSMKTLVEIVDNYRFNNRTKFGNPSEDEYKKAYQDLFTCELLILDDLGTELKSQHMVSELFYIVNERMALGKKTMISSNIALEDIAKVYEERVASRILGNYIHFLILGEDLRLI